MTNEEIKLRHDAHRIADALYHRTDLQTMKVLAVLLDYDAAQLVADVISLKEYMNTLEENPAE